MSVGHPGCEAATGMWSELPPPGDHTIQEVHMNRSFAIGTALGAILVTAGGATAGYKMIVASRDAEVLSVTTVTRSVKSPRQECHDEQVTHTKPVKDKNRLVGTGIGAVVGGFLGNQV